MLSLLHLFCIATKQKHLFVFLGLWGTCGKASCVKWKECFWCPDPTWGRAFKFTAAFYSIQFNKSMLTGCDNSIFMIYKLPFVVFTGHLIGPIMCGKSVYPEQSASDIRYGYVMSNCMLEIDMLAFINNSHHINLLPNVLEKQFP